MGDAQYESLFRNWFLIFLTPENNLWILITEENVCVFHKVIFCCKFYSAVWGTNMFLEIPILVITVPTVIYFRNENTDKKSLITYGGQ